MKNIYSQQIINTFDNGHIISASFDRGYLEVIGMKNNRILNVEFKKLNDSQSKGLSKLINRKDNEFIYLNNFQKWNIDFNKQPVRFVSV